MSHDHIQHILDAHPVVIFGKGDKGLPRCGFTAQVQEVFEELGVNYEMVNILQDQQLRQEMKIFSDWPTFPQVYVRGEFIGGCDIVLEMHEAGELKELITRQA